MKMHGWAASSGSDAVIPGTSTADLPGASLHSPLDGANRKPDSLEEQPRPVPPRVDAEAVASQ